MPLSNLVIHAAVRAFGEALGVSGEAHSFGLGLWVEPPEAAAAIFAAGVGAGLAIVVAARARLFPALAEGARALARPAMFRAPGRAREALILAWIAASSAAATWLLRRAGGAAPASARNVAVGLGLSGLALLAAAYISAPREIEGPRPRAMDPDGAAGGPVPRRAASQLPGHEAPSIAAATLAGLAASFAVWPGVSRPGLAAAVLLALRVKPARALEIALLSAVPSLWAGAFAALPAAASLGAGRALAAALFAFLGALAALSILRALAARRSLAALAAWALSLALALLAYGRALDASPSSIARAAALPLAPQQPPP